jgi:serine/threonine-protein kinase
MGRVLLAHDPVLDRDVAIKVLRPDLQIPADVREGLLVRMRHEAQAAARISHPNVVTLHDMGEDDDVGLFLVFEFVDGPTLKQKLVLSGKLAPHEVAKLATELGSGLGYAHRASILHRDVKPDNVMLSHFGGKMADFGIARIPNSTLTHAGGVLGTPAYSAPETFRAGLSSPESDQFSLAATLYEALFGTRAFPGDDAVAVASKITHDAVAARAESAGLPSAVDTVFARALDKDPKNRFPSAEAFGSALSAALTARPLAQNEPLPLPSHAPEPSRRSGHVAIGALVVLATAAILARTALRSAQQESTPEAAASASSTPASSASATKLRPAPRPRLKPASESEARPSNSTDSAERSAKAAQDTSPPGTAPRTKIDAGP